MLKFCQALQQSPQELSYIVQRNLDNSVLLSLITQQQFLAKVSLELTKVEQTQFFIKNVFTIIREPTIREKQVLREFIQVSTDSNLKDLSRRLILDNKPMHSISDVLACIRKGILQKNNLQIKIALKTQTDNTFSPCIRFLEMLTDSNEQNEWRVKSFRVKLYQKAVQAFRTLQIYPNHQQIYLDIVGILINFHLSSEDNTVYITFFLFNLLAKFKSYVIAMILNVHRNNQKDNLPNLFISRGIFKAFSVIFETQTYFNQQIDFNIQSLSKLAIQTYVVLKSKITPVQLGWLSIFAIDKLACQQNFEKQLHVCASILRQVWFFQPELISQIFGYVISNFVQKVTIADNLDILQSIFLMLTPSEFKYLIFRLNSILSQDKKHQLIIQSSKKQSKTLHVCALFFANSLKEKLTFNQLKELKISLEHSFKEISQQIQESLYNTYQKQFQYFIKYNMFTISRQISELQIHSKNKFRSLLRFYKHLFINDYFSEQFWVNQQKMCIFLTTDQSDFQKLQVLFQFIQEQNIINLSGMMMITILLNKAIKSHSTKLETRQLKYLSWYAQLATKTMKNDVFPSNVTIASQYISLLLKKDIHINFEFKQALDIFSQQKWQRFSQTNHYSRLNYSIQIIVVSIICKMNKRQQLINQVNYLTFYRYNICKSLDGLKFNQFTQRIVKFYQSLNIKLQYNFELKQMKIKAELKQIICNDLECSKFKQKLFQFSENFVLQSPLYREQIVSLTYIAQSPEDNYYFKNHFIPFLYQQYIKIYAKAIQKSGQKSILNQIFMISMTLLKAVEEGDTFNHGINFYKSLTKSQNIYILLSNQILSYFDMLQLGKVIDLCLSIIEKDNYPLLRQYIQVVLCRAYISINKINPNNLYRKKLMSLMKVNINIGIPVSLTLGFELIECSKNPQRFKENRQEIYSIHELLIKFISCHTAYLRGICQYYLYIYMQAIPPTDPFLMNISKYWLEDKDSQKILKNVSLVVEGFREAVQNQCDFLGFERVEEYPTNRVKLEFYRNATRFYTEFILGEISNLPNINPDFLSTYKQAVQLRYEQIKLRYLDLLELCSNKPQQKLIKDNIKRKINQESVQLANKNIVKKQDNKKIKGKQKGKAKSKKQIKQTNIQQTILIEPNQQINNLQSRYSIDNQYQHLYFWLRRNLYPKIIVVATLLEKVHNFGHILRTLNGRNAMLVVPSNIPLQHAECRELVPLSCDVQIVQIRQRDLQKFIILMKNLGYPLVALQQCSRSVKVQEAKFPEKFMLLLGNERLGAPSWLLNEGDLLVQIPQIGKIRSLNVHVSMVICLWESLCRQGVKI